MKLKDEIKKSDPVNETPSTFIAADGSVQENLGSKVLIAQKKEAREKGWCPRCLINGAQRIDVTGLKNCPHCGRTTGN